MTEDLLATRLGGEDRLISASLSNDIADPLRGHVDAIDAERGVEGWVLDLDNPRTPLRVQLVVNGIVVAECPTDLPRDDVASLFGHDVTPGFRFPAEALASLLQASHRMAAGSVKVRVAGTPAVLPTGHAAEALPLPVRDDPHGDRHHAAFNLLARLSTLRAQAAAGVRRPLRPLPEQVAGYIEALATDAAGMVWLLGWKRRDTAFDCPAVVADRQKLPAGLALTLFERPDLDERFSGFIGTLHTDWRPSSVSELHLYLGAEGSAHLGAGKPPKIIPLREFQEQFRQYLGRCHSGHTAALWRLLTRPELWTVPAGSVGVPVQAALDEVLLLPGFGALVSGWAISPLKPIIGFALRLGDAICGCDRGTLFFKPRPDLDSVLPGNRRLLERAGFCGVFRGESTADSADEPVLKVLYDDGSATNHAVDPRVVRRLGRSTQLDAATRLYPSLAAENFFGDFARAVLDDARRSIAPLQPHVVNAAPRAVVLVVPEDRSEIFLLFAGVARYVRSHSCRHGVILVCGTAQTRAEVVTMFGELAAISAVPCSLFSIEAPGYLPYRLSELLARTRTSGFVFVGRGICLTPAGWSAAAELLDAAEPERTVFEITDPASATYAAGPDAGRSAECFAWSAAAFAQWIGDAPFLLDGFETGATFARAGVEDRVCPGAAVRTSLPNPTRLVRAINDIATGRRT
jgi:hypothetical protein